MTYRATMIVVIFAIFASTGCVSSTIQQVRQGETGILGHEAIAILGRRHKNRDETRASFVECVANRASTGSKSVSVIGDKAFLDSLFPWFEPRTAPLELSELGRLVARPEIAQRIKEIGVRYIVWIEGTTERRDQAGTLQCAVASGGLPACFGFLSWEGASDYEATIWDISNQISVGKLSSEARGVSFVPAVIVPLPFIARVQASACNTLADQIKTFITG
ncbi:MAG: hypothetical protein OXG05_07760 [Gammaproteobacteria bacterium]|nr:hypothetical protein [Gammaproteobacteria bacterium]